MERQKALSGLILLASMNLLTNACTDSEDTIDATGGTSSAGKGSGGNAVSGSTGDPGAGEAGMDGSGGKAGSSSGSGGKGSVAGSGGSSAGSDASGGSSGDGSSFGGEGGDMGGSSGDGSGGTTGGSSAAGGSGGTTGGSSGAGGTSAGGSSGGGTGGSGGAPSYCYDALYVPLAVQYDQADFEINYEPNLVDLTDTVLSVRLKAETLATAGGFQVYLKNGAAQNYASAYLGWNNLTDLGDWVTLTYDLSTVTGSGSFDKTQIQWVGFNVTAYTATAGLDDVTIYVDSLTFSDGAAPNVDFNSGVPVLSVNQFNSPVAGAAVSAGICDPNDPGGGGTGGGGAGGASGSGGAGGSGASGGTDATGGTGGSGGSDATGGFGGDGAAGEGGMPGAAGADPGAGGEPGTGGTAGTSGAGGSSGGPTNLIQNGDFETGETWWWYSWGTPTIAVVTSPVHAGTYALAVTDREANDNIVQSVSGLALGETYAVSAWVSSSAPTNGHFTAQITCSVGDPVYQWIQGPQDFDSGAWTNLTGTLDLGHADVTNACTGGTLTGVSLYLEGMGAAIDVFLDDVVVTLNP